MGCDHVFGRFSEFMNGRYGFDKLGGALIIAGAALSVLGRLLWMVWLSRLSLVFYVLFILRFLSKKEYARSRENRIFIEFFNNIKDFMSRDRANYNYYTCPVCKTKFRVPKNGAQGYTAKRVCPKCRNEW